MLCDRRTDRGTRDDSMYRASTAARQKPGVCLRYDTTRLLATAGVVPRFIGYDTHGVMNESARVLISHRKQHTQSVR